MRVSIEDVVDSSAGDGNSLFLKRNGTVWACDTNSYGALGIGDDNVRALPELVTIAGTVAAINDSDDICMFLTNDGKVWSGGDSEYGEAGHSSSLLTPQEATRVTETVGTVKAMLSTGEHSLFLDDFGSVWACGQDDGFIGAGTGTEKRFNPVKISDSGMKMMCAGYGFSLFGDYFHVYSCGWNNAGQLGDGTTTTKSLPVSLSFASTGTKAIAS